MQSVDIVQCKKGRGVWEIYFKARIENKFKRRALTASKVKSFIKNEIEAKEEDIATTEVTIWSLYLLK